VVFGGSAQHGRATNIDVFDGIGKGAAFAGNGFAEGVQVDDQHIDTGDVVLFDGLQMFFAVATCQQTAVDFRVQCFYTAIQNFRRACVFCYFGNGQAGLCQQFGGAASGEQADAALCQGSGKLDNAGFVGN